MSEKQTTKDDKGRKDVLLDHDYDGIHELDNQLPSWWLWGFYLSIVFAIGYVAYYHFSEGPTLRDELEADIVAVETHILGSQKAAAFDEKKLAGLLKDHGALSKGKTEFISRCASCHGDKGQGGIGPNLTDSYWINGDGRALSVASVIRDGVPAKGMPTWGAVLSEEDLYRLTAFVQSLKGTNPPSAKPPQGEKKDL